MFEIIRPGTQFDFVGKRRLWISISAIAILGSIILFFTKGLNYGIDFTGGAEIQVQVPAAWDIGTVRKEMDEGGIKGLKVIQIGEPSAHQFLIKAQGDDKSLNLISRQVGEILGKKLQPGEYEIQRADVVGPAAGASLRTSGFLSMFYALLGILLYVTIRFDLRYSPGAVLALFHDSVITIGVFILTQKQFDLQILAAILALIGYSNNDTIIVYDRVRETLHQQPGVTIEQGVNRAINETLGRTILTALCTFLSVMALWIFGGKVIEDFAFALMVGMVAGTYSSIFIASSFVIYLTHWQEKKAAKMKGQDGKSKRSVTVRPEPKLQS
ncbi:MAG: protein translocase subunit SecF [Oligoflexia bacterium]|nr:protein translocase subunit SecF [Oligoflexia bacterium]